MLRAVWFCLVIALTWCLIGSAANAQDQSPPTAAPTTADQAQEPTGTAEPATTTAADEATAPAKSTDKHDGHDGHAAGGGAAGHEIGHKLPLWSTIFFAAILLCIAIMPLVHGHWWEHNENKAIVAGILALPVLILLCTYGWGGLHVIVHTGREYIAFIALLAALYIISGGIYIKGSLSGTPLANTGLMAIGAVIASLIGTTGASVLLIRPLLRANQTRQNKVHIIIFFIFIVSNCGGLLTPLGDPPLFLGFLNGVPFMWTMQHLWMQWLMVNIALLVIYHIWDEVVFAREEKDRPGSQLEEVMKHEPLHILGAHNFLFLAAIVAVIVGSGRQMFNFGGKEEFPLVKDILMGAIAAVAYFSTKHENREANKFTFAPIIEVAVLFVGIFITMAPALEILKVSGEHIPLTAQWHYFWSSGALSSFLDNAPTYLTFAATASGKLGVDPGASPILKYMLEKPGAVEILAAISCGSVFMGANTYIGNGPNFMVKAIAEESGVKMPSFFGYMMYSGCVLIPLFVVVTIVFFSGLIF